MEDISVKNKSQNERIADKGDLYNFLLQYKNNGNHPRIQEDLHRFLDGATISRPGFEIKSLSREDIELAQKIQHFLETSFKQELLNKLSITEIVVDTNTVWVRVPADATHNISAYDSYIPRDMFAQILESLPQAESELLRSYIRRAECHVAYNSLHPALADLEDTFHTPIFIYNQEFDTQNTLLKQGKIEAAGLQYLSGVDPERYQDMYLLGNVSHEIGHHIFENIILKSDLLQDIGNILRTMTHITHYADSFDIIKNPYIAFHERFAEVIRVYTTNPTYLKKLNNDLFEKIKILLGDE